MNTSTPFPFLLGAQYYRAPTPEPDCWAADLARMKQLGCNAVKFWVQWRWSHRLDDQFSFDDLDLLMDLATRSELQVTLNTIFDVAPHWLYEKYPGAKQVMNNGRVIEPYVVGHRQVGGHPGPCYNHPGARSERVIFMTAVIEHFRGHPALAMWDVWNEPELSFPQRSANIDTLACYCPHCQGEFITWLQAKYLSLEDLNAVWGRCYESWEQVETPRSTQAFTDFVDWREFHIDTMTAEANWRLELVRTLDPQRVRYLHVVPNVLTAFNPVSCAADDFALAEHCDIFAATMNGGPILAQQVLSAARGKTCYNVESHINFGSTNMHQRILGRADLLKDWLPQIGLGIRGFLFWQYRPEVLGLESPAWGLVNLDGSDRGITRAFAEFTEKLTPHLPALLACPAPTPEVGIWKSRKNEIFHFAMQGEFGPLAASLEGYIQVLYWNSIPYRNISSEMLERGELDGLKLLVLPSPYYMTTAEARALDAFVRRGGVVIAEAHLAGYNASTGRHARVLPGAGLASSWGLRESDSTSSFHLKLANFRPSETAQTGSLPEDVRKALADFSTTGGQYFPIQLAGGSIAWGAERYARLEGEGLQALGWFETEVPCLAQKTIGAGAVYYLATRAGLGAQKDPAGLQTLVHAALRRADVRPTANLRGPGLGQVRADLLTSPAGPRFLVLHNPSTADQTVQLDPLPDGTGIFSGRAFSFASGQPVYLPAEFIDLIQLF
jgi:beta-galactosidase